MSASPIRLPNGWRPRPYQLDAWRYLEHGGKHAELIWHRRSGKDEIALHRTACAAHERVANYWHMLPEYAQARKAIWDAVNPHSGKRRIDEAFPLALRATTREQEMQIVFKNGSSWQVVGSDSYNRLVGSTPAGVVFSEWALANPAARAYLRPILNENGGWQMYITTPRGKNHAYRTFKAAQDIPGAFTQKLSATQTGIFQPGALEAELAAYISDYGEDQGRAMYEQEYMCSFDAAILGAYYGREMRQAEEQGRIRRVEYDPDLPVHTAWDLGYSDDTSIWWYQVLHGEVRVLEYHGSNGQPFDYYAELVKAKPYKYGNHWFPHDARAKTLASQGKSIEEMARHAFGYPTVRIVPNLSVQDGIQAARAMFPRTYMDAERCDAGIEALSQYQREWDEDKRAFRDKPLHNWTSHAADAFRYLAVAWREEAAPMPAQPTRWPNELTINELIARNRRREDE